MCITPRCAARGPLFAAAALGRGGTLADTALCTLGTSSWAAGAATCGRDKKKKLGTFSGSLSLGLGGGVSLFWRPLMYSCHSLLAASPFSAMPSRVFMQPWLALERQGESGELPGVLQDSLSPSLQTLMAHSSAVDDRIRSTQKKSQCWFPPQHPFVLSPRAY